MEKLFDDILTDMIVLSEKIRYYDYMLLISGEYDIAGETTENIAEILKKR